MTDPVFLGQYIAALNERGKAAREHLGTASDPYVVVAPPVRGDYIGKGFSTSKSWQYIQGIVISLATMFVQNKYALGGIDIEYDNIVIPSVFPFNSWAAAQTPAGASLPFPPPDGFRRKYPLEITSTFSPAGEVGDVARLLQFGNLGKLYQKIGPSSWTPAAPTILRPTVKDAFGAIQHGDYIGPWIAEDLKNAINLLVWTFGSYFNSGSTGSVNVRWHQNAAWFNSTTTGFGTGADRYDLEFQSGVNLQGPFDDFALAPFPVPQAAEYVTWGDVGTPDEVRDPALKSKSQFKAVATNPSGLSKEYDWYAWPDPPWDGNPGTGGNTRYTVYQGPIRPYPRLTKVETTTGATGPIMPDTGITTIPPMTKPSDPPFEIYSAGWNAHPAVIVRYNVTGGFEYV